MRTPSPSTRTAHQRRGRHHAIHAMHLQQRSVPIRERQATFELTTRSLACSPAQRTLLSRNPTARTGATTASEDSGGFCSGGRTRTDTTGGGGASPRPSSPSMLSSSSPSFGSSTGTGCSAAVGLLLCRVRRRRRAGLEMPAEISIEGSIKGRNDYCVYLLRSLLPDATSTCDGDGVAVAGAAVTE